VRGCSRLCKSRPLVSQIPFKQSGSNRKFRGHFGIISGEILGASQWSWLIDSQGFSAPAVQTAAQESSAASKMLTITCAMGKILYTLDGSDPRLTGGVPSPKAVEYINPVTLPPGTLLTTRVRQRIRSLERPRRIPLVKLGRIGGRRTISNRIIAEYISGAICPQWRTPSSTAQQPGLSGHPEQIVRTQRQIPQAHEKNSVSNLIRLSSGTAKLATAHRCQLPSAVRNAGASHRGA